MKAESQEEPEASLAKTQPIPSQLKRPLPGLPLVHARLVPIIDSGSGGATPFEIREGCEEVVIGRHPGCCQLVLEDKRVSAKHLRIYRTGRHQYFVEQLGSNGCFINEQHLRKGDTRALHHGDEISLCMHAHEVRAQPFAAYLFRISGHETSRQTGPSREAVVAIPRPKPATMQAGSHSVSDQWVRENWDMRDILGKGYFSEVWMGTEVATGAHRAIKAVDKGKFGNFQAKNGSELSLSDEAEVLMGLSHPGIVRVHQWFKTPMHLYLVMDLLAGGDLLDLVINRGSLKEPHAQRLFSELCSAVSFLHSRDVVHRDIKPENILLTAADDEGRAQLGDFGLARRNAHSRDCRTFCGTPSYFAPEVIGTFRERMAGQPAGYGKPVDMWGLGVVLYIMLSGVPPFEGEGGGLYEKIMRGDYAFDVPAWDPVSPEAKRLVKQLMTVDPKERLTVEQGLAHSWVLQLDSEAAVECQGASSTSPKRRRTSALTPISEA